MSLVLSLSKAVLCTAVQCWSVLVGDQTPTGTFYLTQRLTNDAGYGGDVLQFHETETTVYAIHRVWTLRPKEQREKRLSSTEAADRRITNGCINVAPEVYEYLLANFRGSKLEIIK